MSRGSTTGHDKDPIFERDRCVRISPPSALLPILRSQVAGDLLALLYLSADSPEITHADVREDQATAESLIDIATRLLTVLIGGSPGRQYGHDSMKSQGAPLSAILRSCPPATAACRVTCHGR
jgi:hypothetical protein